MKITILFFFLGITGALSIHGFREYQQHQLLHSFKQLALESHVDFDVSMQTHKYQNKLKTRDAQMLLYIFKSLYEKNSLAVVEPQLEVKIPKVIHTIWLGSKLPEKYEQFYQSWKDLHPSWSFVFWTDKKENYDQGTLVEGFEGLQKALEKNATGQFFVVDVKDLVFDNKKFFDEATNYAERSDILRWEAVYRLGGLYRDTDYECLRSMDFLHHMYDFYTGIQPLDTSYLQLGAGLFGAIPGHPIMRCCVETIKDNRKEAAIISKTGPLHFTRALFLTAGKSDMIDIAFPTTYLYPCYYEQAGMPQEVWRKPESLAVHHWEGSWLKSEGFDQSMKKYKKKTVKA